MRNLSQGNGVGATGWNTSHVFSVCLIRTGATVCLRAHALFPYLLFMSGMDGNLNSSGQISTQQPCSCPCNIICFSCFSNAFCFIFVMPTYLLTSLHLLTFLLTLTFRPTSKPTFTFLIHHHSIHSLYPPALCARLPTPTYQYLHPVTPCLHVVRSYLPTYTYISTHTFI